MSDPGQPPPFSPAVAIGMVAAGVLCFAGFVVVFALARGPGAHDGGAHAASRSAVGFVAVADLLRALGTPVLVSRSPQLKDSPGVALLVLTPPPGKAPPGNVTNLVAADSVLLVLPKWRTQLLDDHPGWVRAQGLLPPAAVLSALPPGPRGRLLRRPGTQTLSLRGDAFKSAVTTGPVDRLQVLDGTALKPMLRDAGGGIVLGVDGNGLIVLSDPDLLNNQGLATAEGAAGAVLLLRTLADDGTIAFDLSLNGLGRAHDPLRAIFEPPLLGATLCAAAAALLTGLLSAVRFGPAQRARRSFDLGKAALAANSAALILRAGREARLAEPYAALTRTGAARLLGLPRRLTAGEATDTLDRMARQRDADAETLPALFAAAGSVRDRAGLLAVAQRLHRWKQELVRAD